ncbi:helix-turn-helix domain-containing protein, partial [Bacillus haynesii]
MKKNGISTQKELAQQLGISKNQLSMLLSPNFNPVKSNALKLCEILNVNFEEIIESEQIELALEE